MDSDLETRWPLLVPGHAGVAIACIPPRRCSYSAIGRSRLVPRSAHPASWARGN